MLQACRPVLRALTAPRPPLSLRHMGKYSVYAVASGRNPGLYSSWGETESQVRQYSGSQYKGFHSVEAAQAYMESRGAAPSAPEPASSSGYGASYSLGGSSSYARSGSRSSSSSQARSSHEPSYGHDSYQPGRSFSSAPAYDHQAGATLSHSWTEEDDDDSYLPPHSSYSAAPVARAQPQPPPPKSIRLEFDGASKNNPGPAGLGAVLYDADSGLEVKRVCHYMGHRTNNQAEYGGLIAGLQAAKELGCRDIHISGDSLLVINQLKGDWRVQHEGLKPYHAVATSLLGSFDKVEARQVPRSMNAVADALSNQAISEHRSGTTSQVWQLENPSTQQ
ncbi:hypothetical protein ACKKBG_A06985 [Auxenochlorella protothecoides x Auxenochlorella symbiontica]